ncbi:Actin- protein 3 [Characodon lateralis]|uniref:Actin- protein 3 n=1 Tax=Characodon lateralis TaxID=208331 RepID=A0ABU7F0I3_9TELE|nr:Actin- protein 3 [Characodon lateralis]
MNKTSHCPGLIVCPSVSVSQAEGYVIGSCIKHIPIAGRDITYFTQQLLREREVGIPPEQSLETAKAVKERFSYVCPDLVKEFNKYDTDGSKWIKQYTGINAVSKKEFTIDVGYERFLGPEIFFHPEFANPDFTQPISEVVDEVIQNCPIDVRRPLYKNVVLSGGSTMFRDFGRRLQRDLKRTVDARLKLSEELSGGKLKPKPIDVQVVTHHMQRYAVWFGGSMLASTVSSPNTSSTCAYYSVTAEPSLLLFLTVPETVWVQLGPLPASSCSLVSVRRCWEGKAQLIRSFIQRAKQKKNPGNLSYM